MALYEICFEVKGTPVETDELIKKLERSILIRKVFKKYKNPTGMVYKRKLEDVV
jgi:hypothetical protein